MLDFTSFIKEIEQKDQLSLDESFKLVQNCSSLLYNDESLGRKLLINILEYWSKLHPSTHEIWVNLIESAGFYPYLNNKQENLNNLSGEIRKELHKSENISKYFHEEQLEVLRLLQTEKNVIVSAPTSFGKSLLIEEIVASCKYRNIVIIQPTLALLDETRRKLLRYNESYKLIVRTSQEPSNEKGNIFLFTAERVNEYTYFDSVNFLVIDEFYKLS
ncbi:MAG: DEAD/DEAH box helicase, partial [Bacteroides sp.]|nr:DEAD/DEAH box helicase [Bacteroides sp.]